MEKTSFNYMLRRTLPLWKWEEIAKETIAHCQRVGIEEIIWIIDPEDFTHGLPTLEEIDKYLPVLQNIKAMQEPTGILFSLNPWVTLGHVERGRNMTAVHSNMNFMTDQSGYTSKAIACPLSLGWQEWVTAAYSCYASLLPHILWLEDDFRLFNHGDIAFGCFCKEHLNRFSDICGYEYTREELLDVLLRSDQPQPHPHRELWLNMNAKIMEDVMTDIEKTVHKVSSGTNLGLMCSSPQVHAIEGRNWNELMRALCGTTQRYPVARPSMGSYNEFEIMDVLEGLDGARITSAILPENTILCPELENCFYSTYAKSVRHTRLQIGLSALMGATHLTMNLYDFIGGNIKLDDPFMQALGEVKPKLSSLATLSSLPLSTEESGSVFVEFLPEGAKDTRVIDTTNLHELAPKTTGWSRALQPCGIPVSFKEGKVQAITGDYFYSKTNEEIEKLLSKSLLIDGSAAQTLQQLGYENDIGVVVEEIFQQNTISLGAEEFHNSNFGGKDYDYMTIITTTLCGKFAKLSASAETQIISSLTDENRNRILPCMTAFENSYGGRIIVYAGDLSEGFSRGLKTCFLNPVRERQLGSAIKWLSNKYMVIQNLSGAYHITMTRRYDDFLYVGLANMSTDSSDLLTFQMLNVPPIEKVYELSSSGWNQIDFKQQEEKLSLEISLEYKDFSALKIYFI